MMEHHPNVPKELSLKSEAKNRQMRVVFVCDCSSLDSLPESPESSSTKKSIEIASSSPSVASPHEKSSPKAAGSSESVHLFHSIDAINDKLFPQNRPKSRRRHLRLRTSISRIS
jgi:hypothetical protein